MAISVGDQLPDATLITMGADGPEQVKIAERVKGRKTVIFALPGAFTGTCSTAHVPSFMRTKDQFMAKGVDEIICISVNDPFVMQAWSESTGANEVGITHLADPLSDFTKSVGMDWSAPAVGFVDRSSRYAMLVEDGKVSILQVEEGPGVCEVSSGEALLEAM